MLAILTTHPIQYQVPLWKALANDGRIPFEVWYLSDHGTKATYDKQFGQTFAWDIDTLSGYPYQFLKVNSQTNVNRFMGLRIEESLGTLLRARQVQALWIQGWQVFAYWQAARAAYQLNIPVWLRAETNDLHKSHWLRRLPRSLALHQLFRWVSRFLYIGTANRRFYQQFSVVDSKMIAAPYFVDNARFAQATKDLEPKRQLLRQKWGIPENSTCFLFCGKFIHKKHPLDLLEAAQLLLEKECYKQNPSFHLLLVGEGELRSLLEAKALQLNAIAGRPVVSFAGFLNQVNIPEAYVAADCLVLPSDTGETWGLVVNEAMACGRPAIVSNLCGCAEDLIYPLDTDYVYPFGDSFALANRLEMFIHEKTKSPLNTKINALMKQHSAEIVLANVVTAYKEILESAKK